MGNSSSTENLSNDSSQQPTPAENSVLARLSSLSLLDDNTTNYIQDQLLPSTSSNNQGPPSLAAAASIAARQRLIEELQYLAQQRYIDEVTIDYNLNNGINNTIVVGSDGDRNVNSSLQQEEHDEAGESEMPVESSNQNDSNDEVDYVGLSLLQRVQISLLRREVCFVFCSFFVAYFNHSFFSSFKSSFFVHFYSFSAVIIVFFLK